MHDVVVVGAGPAGAVAAAALARAGAKVCLLDRARFPRDKLCGDTINPGALALLRRFGLADSLEAAGLPLAGMRVTGEGGVSVESRYPGGRHGLALVRRTLDSVLLDRAIEAGAAFEPATTVRRPVVAHAARLLVNGVVAAASGRERVVPARVVIAADGRHSTLAFGLGLARHPRRPRRWAIGAYFEDVAGLSTVGEMHVGRGRYIGIAPVPGGAANVCLVKTWDGRAFGDPASLLRAELARDGVLGDRFAGARMASRPMMLGPLAVEIDDRAIEGLLVAGDAAGFVDPMTGDGLRFALRGGELAAMAALRALDRGWTGVHAELRAERRREFAGKLRFNRALRTLVASPVALQLGGTVASLAPGVLRAIVRYAGDCRLS